MVNQGGSHTDRSAMKLYMCDLNWSFVKKEGTFIHTASAPQDWCDVDAEEYFHWHRNMGCTPIFMQAYTFSGYAFYPTKLGPFAPGKGSSLLPRLYELARQHDMPFCSYFCVGTDLVMSNLRNHWVVPDSRPAGNGHGFLAPETEWTDLLCERIREFLGMYPVDYLLFDWFVYGDLRPDSYTIKPAWYMKQPFLEIIGRTLPESAADITAEENLRYKREIMARQFHRIRDAVKQTSPNTRIMFNVPYWNAKEALWEGHPMMNESDLLFAESSKENVLDWLLKVRKPGQGVMTTIIGRLEEGECDPYSWEKWHEKGCDFFGYTWGVPPEFRPHSIYERDLNIIRDAFRKMDG